MAPSKNGKVILVAVVLGLMFISTVVVIWFNGPDNSVKIAKEPANNGENRPASPKTPPGGSDVMQQQLLTGIDPSASTGIITKPRTNKYQRQAGWSIPMVEFDEREGGQETKGIITWVNRLTWLKYADVNFEDGSANVFVMKVECAAEHAGCEVIVRVDATDGPEVARLKVVATPTGGTYQSAPVSRKVSGSHDVFLTFSAGGMNMWSFKFIHTAQPALLPLFGAEFDDGRGVLESKAMIMQIDEGDWVKYPQVDFGGGMGAFGASLGVNDAAVGGTIQLRIDKPDGPVIASLKTASTGGPFTVVEQLAPVVGNVTGQHDVYLTVSGRNVGNIRKIVFYKVMPAPRLKSGEVPPAGDRLIRR